MSKKNEAEIKLPFESNAFKEAWDEWLQFRKERRVAKYVPKGLEKTFTHLINISCNNDHTAILIIEQSMQNNWQGLFELKNKNGANKPNNSNRGTTAKAGYSEAL